MIPAHGGAKVLVVGGTVVYTVMLVAALVLVRVPPELVLALTLAGAVLAAVVLNPLIGVHVFVMLLFVENAATAGGVVTGMKATGSLILFGWFMNLAVRRESPLRIDGFTMTMALFIAWASTSLLYAGDETAALGRLLTFIQLVVATLMVMSVASTLRRVEGILWALVIWTTLATIVSLGLYVAHVTPTVSGLRENRNAFAIFINIAIVCAVLLRERAQRPAARTVLLGALPVLFLGLALTFSRVGLIVLGCSLLMLWYGIAKERKIAPFLLAVVVLGALSFFLPEAFWDRAQSILPAVQERKDTFGTRVGLWELGLQMIRDRPLAGVGLGNFVAAIPRYAEGEMLRQRLAAHNSYITVAAETGLIGLALFLCLHALALRAVFSAFKRGVTSGSAALRLNALAVASGVIAIMVSSLSGSNEGQKYLWLLLGLAVSLGRTSSEAQPAVKADAPDAEISAARAPA